MCGVAGIVALTDAARAPTREELARMAAALGHRGPDDSGVVLAGRAGLAHTRLAIVDLTGGKQPMTSDDGAVVLSYNGEVFRFVELRAELARLGRTFRTASDTEVVLRAYEEWGESCFARLDGQFAIAVWDGRRRRLLLARDRLGVRPLHTCRHAGRLYFASEIKAIFAADPTIPRALDPDGLAETFTFWCAVAPRTAFTGVAEVLPGHVRIVQSDGETERAYWSPSFTTTFSGSIDDAAAAVRAALARAVDLRITRADVPVGAYLSGGLDSSLVAALAGERLQTFSVRFDDPTYDEGEWQRLVARALGTDHHELVVTGRDVAEAFPAVVRHAERPLLRTAPAPLHLLSRAVRDAGIKVVLTGEGADETFAGYDLFREAKVRRFWARQPGSKLRPRLLERLYPWSARSPQRGAMGRAFFGRDLARAGEPGFGHEPRWRTTQALQRLFARDVRVSDPRSALLASMPSDVVRAGPLAQEQWLEMKTLLAGYILSSQGDRMLMAHSVEGRFPFLDVDVVELAGALPPSYKLFVLDEKHVVKRAARGLVPPAVLVRPKQPYRGPDARALLGAEWARELLSERALAQSGIFDASLAARVVAKCTASEDRLSNSDDMALVGIASAQLLQHELVGRIDVAHRDDVRLLEVTT